MAKNSTTATRARQETAARKPKPRRSPHTRAIAADAPPRKSAAARPVKSRPATTIQPKTAAASFAFYLNPTLTLVCVPSAEPAPFSLEVAAGLTGVHPEMLRYYCRLGLLGPERAETADAPTFDEEALREVRRIEHYRRHLAVSRRALPLICELRREAERQNIALHFLRVPQI